MARDVIVTWKGPPPPRPQVQVVLEDFFSEIAKEVRWDQDRFFILLPGAPKSAVGRIPELARLRFLPSDERWIEVWPSPEGDCLYVMTRMMDDVTNVLADGLADLLARVWRGKLER